MRIKLKNKINTVCYEYFDRLLGDKSSRVFDYWCGVERKGDSIVVYIGHGHTPLVIYTADGRVRIEMHYCYPALARIAVRYSPFVIWEERVGRMAQTFGRLGYTGEEFAFSRPEAGSARTLSVDLLANGRLFGNIEDAVKARQALETVRKERWRRNARSLYWLKKARGISVDRSGCRKGEPGAPSFCHSQGVWFRHVRRGHTWSCGCKVVQKAPKCRGLTVDKIMKETNASIRAAQMNCYGVGKFFLDAKAQIIDELEPNYQLMRLTMGDTEIGVEDVTALQMECPSTGQIHVNAVPPEIQTVRTALDWMFNTPDYLDKVGQQT